MPLYKVKATILNFVRNADKVVEGALEGRKIEPYVERHSHGAEVEMTEDQASRHLATGALEGPVEESKPEAKSAPTK